MLPITARQSWYSGELCLPGDVQIVDLGAMIGKDIHVAARRGDSRGYLLLSSSTQCVSQ
jgi:hypothetical protein